MGFFVFFFLRALLLPYPLFWGLGFRAWGFNLSGLGFEALGLRVGYSKSLSRKLSTQTETPESDTSKVLEGLLFRIGFRASG